MSEKIINEAIRRLHDNIYIDYVVVSPELPDGPERLTIENIPRVRVIRGETYYCKLTARNNKDLIKCVSFEANKISLLDDTLVEAELVIRIPHRTKMKQLIILGKGWGKWAVENDVVAPNLSVSMSSPMTKASFNFCTLRDIKLECGTGTIEMDTINVRGDVSVTSSSVDSYFMRLKCKKFNINMNRMTDAQQLHVSDVTCDSAKMEMNNGKIHIFGYVTGPLSVKMNDGKANFLEYSGKSADVTGHIVDVALYQCSTSAIDSFRVKLHEGEVKGYGKVQLKLDSAFAVNEYHRKLE
jgi:hypothetical protein